MDSNKQDALISIENSIYRTALKLRSVQTLCQLDLMDSSLIQQVFLRQSLREDRESSLSVQQIFQELQELFHRPRVGKLGQVDPRAPELTLSLLMAMYDSTGSGFLKLLPVAAALIALSGDSPLTKYRALFQLYAENKRGNHDSGARMTRKVLRHLLTDLQQIPTVVGESHTLCSVESAIRSCFRGVLSPGIKEEKFLSWLQSEPLILLWLPTCHRLSATEMAAHPVRCSICRTFPIMGLRYRCLKCLNFDTCQVCFLSGLHSKSHQKSHAIVEHCVQQVSAKENTKLLVRTLRNNLLQGYHRGKEALRRQWLLDQVALKDTTTQAQARLSIQYNSPKAPLWIRPTGPVETAATKTSRRDRQKVTQAQQADDSNPHYQTIVTHESINALHRERRLLKKQLNQYRDKLQAIYTSQEEKSFRLETEIHKLAARQDSLWTKLQQMQQNLQIMLQPLYPSSSCQNMAPKADHSSADRFWEGGDSSQINYVTEDSAEREPLPNSAAVDRSHRGQASAKQVLPSPETPKSILQSTTTQSHPQKMLKDILSSLPSCQEGLLQDNPHISPAKMSNASQTPEEMKEIIHTNERQDELEEEELQELLSELLDAFNLEMPSGPRSSVNMDLYSGAERVCRAFSAFVDQIILPSLKREGI